MVKTDSKDKDRELAYFRFALIAPVIQGMFTDASIAAYCRRVTEDPIARPDGTLFQYKPATLEKWIALYKAGGMNALVPKERSDKGSVRALSDECILEIHKIKEKFPRLDAAQIHIRLVQDGFLPASVSPRTIQRFVKANGLKTVAASGLWKDRKAYEEPFFGAMWQADTCYFPYIPDGGGKRRRTYLIAIVDDHSRMIVGARLFFEDNAYNFQKVLKDAVGMAGIPNKLYCDHGPSYENSQLSFICGSMGTVLLHAPVRDGAAKGKAERTFSTLKSRWLNGLDTDQILSLDEFNQELAEAVRKHNLSVNSSTGQTPMDRFLATQGRVRVPESEDWLNECFMNRMRRKVRNDSTLSLQNTQFDAPMQFMRQTVEVRFLPDRLSEAYIFENGAHYPLKLTDKQANSRAKREVWPMVDYSKGV
ncbi:MAG: DDE-type integrase/transposase/recombinase [Treponema sp.]|jgi:transposase InsO family protein|nr:DDE-type integrase/transposase/recombinase [Treponema sp.]